jgi:hypothetical protein
MGFAIDASVVPKQIYWYKVVGIDQSGNEALLDKAVPVSTFDFTTAQAPLPTITAVTGSGAAPFALTVRWNPAFDAAQHRGYAVFKSEQAAGLYRQVGTLLSASEFRTQVVRGATYWYKIVLMDRISRSPRRPCRSAALCLERKFPMRRYCICIPGSSPASGPALCPVQRVVSPTSKTPLSVGRLPRYL